MSSQRKIYRLGKAPLFILGCAPLTIALSGLAEMQVNAIHQGALRDKAAIVSLGRELFNDTRLSGSGQQACSTCHSTGVSVLPHKANESVSFVGPAIRYANHPAIRDPSSARGSVVRMWTTMGLSPAALRNVIVSAPYAARFSSVFGDKMLRRGTPESVMDVASAAVAAFEASNELNPFDSKFDYAQAGITRLTAREARGFALFTDPGKGNCASCHAAKPVNGEPAPLFASALQSRLPAVSSTRVDDQPAVSSSFSSVPIPTLRNVAVRGRFFHDGRVTSLAQAVSLSASLNPEEVGDVVAFLSTLTDGFDPVAGQPALRTQDIAQQSRSLSAPTLSGQSLK